MSKKRARKTCEWCGNKFDGDRCVGPFEDHQSKSQICYECWRNECTFECCLCGETEDTAFQHEIGGLLAVAGPNDEDGETEAGVPAGIYRITAHPYFMQGMIGGGWVFPSAVERLRDVPEKVDTEGYPCGHFCRECARKLQELAAPSPVTQQQAGEGL